jgi:hypothetical protein
MRYVNTFLIIFETTKINLYTINTYISNINNNIKLNPTYEHTSIDFLDLTISREHKKLKVDIYRKPTTTDNNSFLFQSSHRTENGSI